MTDNEPKETPAERALALKRRKTDQPMNVKDAVKENFAVALLIFFNLVIIALAVIGIMTTNQTASRQIEEAREQQVAELREAQEKAAAGTRVISCLFAELQDHRDTTVLHINEVRVSLGMHANPIPKIKVTNETLEEACKGIDQVIANEVDQREGEEE